MFGPACKKSTAPGLGLRKKAPRTEPAELSQAHFYLKGLLGELANRVKQLPSPTIKTGEYELQILDSVNHRVDLTNTNLIVHSGVFG
jgi:hypothetical protein